MQVNEKNFPYHTTTPANETITLQNQTKWLINTLQQKQNWEKVRLEEVSKFIRGVVYSKDDELEINNGLVILRSNNVDFTTNKLNFENLKFVKQSVKAKKEQCLIKDDVLISVSNSKEQTGKVAFSNQNTTFYVGGFMAILRPQNVNPYFFFLMLLTDNFKNFIASRNQGTTNIWNITFDRIRDYAIHLPPLPIQKQIADLLWSIEDQITATQQTQTTLQQLKKKLLHQLFSPSLTDNNNSLLFTLQKEDFKQVKFGEVVQQISEQVKPQTTNLTIYIGLEHLEPEQLSITSFGKPSDVEGIKLRAYKGDIIFGKRRAYQRKAAICNVDAIVSAHAMILRANPEKILPNFLPFFMQSDEFMDRAVSISEGSLSPTIKWNVLAKQEFYLPPLSIQGQLAALFNHLEHCLQEAAALLVALQGLKKGLINSLM